MQKFKDMQLPNLPFKNVSQKLLVQEQHIAFIIGQKT
jgi:hypothetical protein